MYQHTSSIILFYDRLQRRHSTSTRAYTTIHRRHSLMENIFITALVRAGLCRQHAREKPSSCHQGIARSLVRGHRTKPLLRSAHAFHSKTSSQALAAGAMEHSVEEDPRQFVDFYISSEKTGEQASCQTKAAKAVLELPSIEASGFKSSGLAKARPSTEEETLLLEHFLKMIDMELENQEEVYEIYQKLPHPRITYLSRKYRSRFLVKLAVVEKKTPQVAQRYISVLEDIRAAGLHIFLSEWNSAIHLVGRQFARVTTEEAEAAVLMYKEMERAGIEGSHVTFNILFDIAVKAGDFAFAEVILKEMNIRKLYLDRYVSVGKIYYHGLRHDGKGVRDAYVDLINCGQIVDTVVLNCVIASLLNAGERATAEQVYYRMRKICTETKGYVFEHQSFRDQRNIARVLTKASIALKHSSDAFRQLQDEQPRTPNFRTFKILLRYHVEVTGEMQGVTAILDDMTVLGVPAYGSTYWLIFKGFALHGGVPYTAWTKTRLEKLWDSFMSAVSVENDFAYLGKWPVIWILRAFGKCHGKDVALAKWEIMKEHWHPTEEEAGIVYGILSHQEYMHQKGWS